MFIRTDVSEELADLPSSGLAKKGGMDYREESATLVPICNTLQANIPADWNLRKQ
jgi:hypothetical protein